MNTVPCPSHGGGGENGRDGGGGDREGGTEGTSESGDSGGEYSNGLPPLCRLTQTVAVNSVLFWTQLDRPWQRDPLELVSPRAAPRPAAAAAGAQRQCYPF